MPLEVCSTQNQSVSPAAQSQAKRAETQSPIQTQMQPLLEQQTPIDNILSYRTRRNAAVIGELVRREKLK